MTYEEALDTIHGFAKFTKKRGIDRMKAFIKDLGNPQNELKCIHIAGTNGKGSTAAMLSSVLTQAGYKTGLYTSPFIYDFRERMQINHQLIPKEELVRLLEEVLPLTEKFKQEGNPIAEFELITALAFLWFARQKCDIVVLEVGLGGRWDATNCIEKALVSVITSISLDHTQILGDTAEQIAQEKCGILKQGGNLVCYPMQTDSVIKVIKERAEEKGNTVIMGDIKALAYVKVGLEGSVFRYKEEEYYVPLMGMHQVYNAITVLETLEAIKTKNYKISRQAICQGIARVQWPGRIEVLNQKPCIIMDGSHNVSGIEALMQVLQSISRQKLTIVFGMLQDKDYTQALEMIGFYADELILIKPDSARAVPKELLVPLAQKVCKQVKVAGNLDEVFEQVLPQAGKDDLIVICGSLYLIADIKKAFQKYEGEDR